jgi:transcription elongation factor Elf1
MKLTDADNCGHDEWWCEWFSCPVCNPRDKSDKYQSGYITQGFNYCPMCGTKIEWEAMAK